MIKFKRPSKEWMREQCKNNPNYSLRRRDSQKFDPEYPIPQEFQDFSDKQLWPMLPELHQGYKIEEKQRLLASCALQLLVTKLTNTNISDARNSKNEFRTKIWDALCKNRLARKCIGSKCSKQVTRYEDAGKVVNLQNKWVLSLISDTTLYRYSDSQIPTNQHLVIIRKKDDDDKKYLLTLRAAAKMKGIPVHQIRDYVTKRENQINSINEILLRHTWTTKDDRGHIYQIDPSLREIHSRGFQGFTRLYTRSAIGGQNIPREHRQRLRIDQEPTAEVDGKSYQIRLLYHRCKLDSKKDLYKTEEIFPESTYQGTIEENTILREFIKDATIKMLNSNSRKQALSAITKAVRESIYKKVIAHAVYNLEGYSGYNDILDAILQSHPQVVQKRFFDNLGESLMTLDGAIMFHTVFELAQLDIPVLAIHDAVIIKRKDVAKAKKIFRKCYHRKTGFYPVLEVVSGRSKPAGGGRLKTGHIEERDLLGYLELKNDSGEAQNGKSAQYGTNSDDFYPAGAGAVEP